jgi:hypothetical protein
MDLIENEQIKGIHRNTETQQVDLISLLTEIRGEDITGTNIQTDTQTEGDLMSILYLFFFQIRKAG